MFFKPFSLKLITLLFIYAATTHIHSKNKIIYLISPPRSLSVAFMRMMEARGDFTVMHEPSQFAFVKGAYPLAENWFIPEAAQSFEEVKTRIFQQAQQTNVFVKEISFAVHGFLLTDQEFMKDNDVRFVFLVRDPHHAIISFYKKFTDDPVVFSNLVGYKTCYELFKHINKHSAHKPYLILSEDLYSDPFNTIAQFCTALDIPFKPTALTWHDLGSDFSGKKEWREIKHQEAIYHWHGDAIRSSSFGMPHAYKVDATGKPTFEEVEDLACKKMCEQAYEENLKHYKLLLSEMTS